MFSISQIPPGGWMILLIGVFAMLAIALDVIVNGTGRDR